MMRLINVLVISGLLVGCTSFNGKAQNYIVNCELSTSFKKQINEWNKRFGDKTKFEEALCEEAIGAYTKCISELSAPGLNCQTKDSLLVYLHKMLGNTFRYANDNFSALAQYKTAIDISEKCNCSLIQKAHSMFNFAVQKRLYKDFSAAEQYFLAANRIYIKNYGKYDFWVGLELLTTYDYWGYPLGHSKLDSIYYLLNDLYDKNRTRDIRVNYLAAKHIKYKKYVAAHEIYNEALIFYLNDSSYVNWVKVNISKIDLLIKQNRLNEVPPILNAISNIVKKHKLNLNLHHLKADLLLTKAAYHTVLKQYPQAQQYHQQILQFINPLFNYETIYQNPKPNQIFGNPYLLTTLADKAEVFKKMHHQTGNKNNLIHALNCYELSYKAADQMRKNYSFEDANTYLSDYTYSYYEKAIELCQILAKTFPEQKNQYQQKAFEIAQRSSMKTLFWEINSKAADYHHLDEATKAQKKQLQTQIISVESELKNKPENDELKKLRFENRRELEQIDKQQKENIKEYSETQFCHFSDFSVEPDDLQNNLQPNQAVLNYFMGDSLIYCFLITKNKFKIIEIESPELITANVIAFRNDTKEGENTKDLGHQLYQRLLEKAVNELSGKVESLIIIPDGILSALPFEALQKTNQYHNYLLNDYTISYDLHSSLLKKTTNNDEPPKMKAVGFSVGDFSNWKPLGLLNLDFSKEEVDNLIDEIGGTKFHDVSKQEFLQHFSKASIVHISSHATADTLDASNSRIYFARNNENEFDDILYRDEILNQQCVAEMIVLSACETGLGKQNRSEKVASLARAFRTIGSKSEVMSLWNIGENSTFEIMKDFYKFLKEGKPKNEALREAKLQYLANHSSDNKRNPKNWAGLALQGDIKPLYKNH